jgi:flavin reductase (DIM6/NTAB) family NADH-FMN oxidoreductase RutF
VTITTVLGADGRPHGITVSSFTSVSLDPPLVLVCIDHRSQMLNHLKVNQPFGINVLSDQQQDLSVQFSQRWNDRFADVRWYYGCQDVPLLFDVPAAFACRTTVMMPAGDHVVVIGLVLHVQSNEKWPLTYINSTYGQLVQP